MILLEILLNFRIKKDDYKTFLLISVLNKNTISRGDRLNISPYNYVFTVLDYTLISKSPFLYLNFQNDIEKYTFTRKIWIICFRRFFFIIL